MINGKLKTKKTDPRIIIGGTLVSVFLLILTVSIFSLTPCATSPNEVILIHKKDSPKQAWKNCKFKIRYTHYQLLRLLFTITGDHLQAGRYELHELSTINLFRRLRSGAQTPIRITIPHVRTKEQLCSFLGRHLEADSAIFYKTFNDSLITAKYNLSPSNILTLFIPNTYEVYWTTSPQNLLTRMQRESNRFWNTNNRLNILVSKHLTTSEAYILASIIAQETTYDPEKPRIAGMYINRLKRNMLLQADPTLKYATHNFSCKRICGEMLTTDSPYNTYTHIGLPPGPICIPDINSIKAVINAEQHNYLFMCANEDFSGKHRFAYSFAEHQRNARKYIRQLNKRNIQK